VNDYNKALEGPGFMHNWHDEIKFEAVPKVDFGNSHYGRTIGLVLAQSQLIRTNNLQPEVMIVETPYPVHEDKRHG
jgi:hypothetical protein